MNGRSPLHPLTRRRFLQYCGAGTFTGTFSSLLTTAALAQPGNDYKALVCILLAGGNDSFNMLVPNENDTYAAYQATRSDLALARGTLLGISPIGADTRAYGLHPGMGAIKALFDAGKLAFMTNVGTLVEPHPSGTPDFNTLKEPLGLYSHADQIGQWQTGLPDQRSIKGWGGRMSDVLRTLNANPSSAMGYSIDGSSVYLAGEATDGFTISNEAVAPGVDHYGRSDWWFPEHLTRIIDAQLEQSYDNLIMRTLAERTRSVIDNNDAFTQAVAAAPAINTSFGEDRLSLALRGVARTIAARDNLSMRRQSFFVTLGGWDNHDELLNNQIRLLGWVNAALNSFQEAMAELDVENQVTVFTTSDFARTLTSNGRGSDHGWGGNQIVMGGAVNGAQLFGAYPDLALAANPLMHDPTRGTFAPTTSTDEFFAEMALWFGVPPGDLAYVLPNVERFFTPVPAGPLGILT